MRGTSVCLAAKTLAYPELGGHLWVYLNWALGLRAIGCEVIWLEVIRPEMSADSVRRGLNALKDRLAPFGLADGLAICTATAEPIALEGVTGFFLSIDEVAEADILLNLIYDLPSQTLQRFRRTALLDIDPGLLQVWMSQRQLAVAPHDIYFSTGETVGLAGSLVPDCGLTWHYTPPVVYLPAWPLCGAEREAPYTTVSNWWGGEWVVFGAQSFNNDKRVTFLEYATLPSCTPVALELALYLGPGDEGERELMERAGWRIRSSAEVTATPQQYQEYIRSSRGEISCVKPSCIVLQNAWISDRTLCYLASGRPAVVQHTGESRFLAEGEGLFRFRSLAEAARALETIEADYDRHSRAARQLVEEHFSAERVVRHVLERAL